MLRAVGRKDQKLSQRIDLFLNIQQCRAQFLPERRSARFTGGHHLQAAHAQFAGQQAQLRGFSATVDPFKSDEKAGHFPLACWMGICSGGRRLGALFRRIVADSRRRLHAKLASCAPSQ